MPITYFVSGIRSPEGDAQTWRVMRYTWGTKDKVEVLVDKLPQIQAEILCAMKLEEMIPIVIKDEVAIDHEHVPKRRPRQLAFKF